MYAAYNLTMGSQNIIGDQDVDSKPQLGNVTIPLENGRTFLLNVPEAYEHGQSHPLVLSFHGGKFTPPPSLTP